MYARTQKERSDELAQWKRAQAEMMRLVDDGEEEQEKEEKKQKAVRGAS